MENWNISAMNELGFVSGKVHWDLYRNSPLLQLSFPFSAGFRGMPCHSSTICCNLKLYTPKKSWTEKFDKIDNILQLFVQMGLLVLTRDSAQIAWQVHWVKMDLITKLSHRKTHVKIVYCLLIDIMYDMCIHCVFLHCFLPPSISLRNESRGE